LILINNIQICCWK